MPTRSATRVPTDRKAEAVGAAWTVYILRCGDGSLYTGITNDITRRLAAHAAGRASRYTRSRLPVRLVHTEFEGTKSLALRREAAIKRLPRAAKLRLVTPAAPRARRRDAVRPRHEGGRA